MNNKLYYLGTLLIKSEILIMIGMVEQASSDKTLYSCIVYVLEFMFSLLLGTLLQTIIFASSDHAGWTSAGTVIK